MTAFIDLPELSGVRLLTISGWFDGPLSGLAVYQDRTLWYQARGPSSDDEGNPWEYALVDLSPAQLAYELECNEAFRRLVGKHWDVDDDGRLRPGGDVTIDKAAHAQFYEQFPPEAHSYQGQPVIGRFSIDPRHLHGIDVA